eukprot:5466450-Karenia_brevis.AAC.1
MGPQMVRTGDLLTFLTISRTGYQEDISRDQQLLSPASQRRHAQFHEKVAPQPSVGSTCRSVMPRVWHRFCGATAS